MSAVQEGVGGGGGSVGGKEQLSAILKMIAESQTLDGDGKELVSTGAGILAGVAKALHCRAEI